MGAKIKPKKSVGLPTKPKKFLGPKINPQKSHAKFPSLKNFQKALTVITQKQPQNKFGCTLFAELHGQNTQALHCNHKS